MNPIDLFIFLVIGAIAGWLASILTRGKGRGLIMNVIMGCIGAIVGSFVFEALGVKFTEPLLGKVITATAGAILVVIVARILK